MPAVPLKKLRALMFVSSACLLSSGCATALRGVSEPFKVITQPPGATVTTSRETRKSEKARKHNPALHVETYGCSPTPCEFEIARRSTFIARIEKPGFVPVYVTVRSKAMTATVAQSGTGTAAASAAGTAVWLGAEGATMLLASASLTTTLVGVMGLTVGAPSIAIDAVSGSMLSLYPNPLTLKLVPKSESNLAAVHIDPDALIQEYNAQQALKAGAVENATTPVTE